LGELQLARVARAVLLKEPADGLGLDRIAQVQVLVRAEGVAVGIATAGPLAQLGALQAGAGDVPGDGFRVTAPAEVLAEVLHGPRQLVRQVDHALLTADERYVRLGQAVKEDGRFPAVGAGEAV